MRLRYSLLILLAAAIVCCGSVCAQTHGDTPRAGMIRGTIYDPRGGVVAHARVDLLQSMIAVAHTETDARGKYSFSQLSAGTYLVAANAPGLTSTSSPFELSNGKEVTLDLHLALSAVQEQVVVSSSLGGVLEPQIGSSVTVVNKQQIQNEGVETLADALRNVPGVDINRTGQLGAVTSAFVRGGDSNYNLVMIDGIPMNDFGGGFDLAPLPTSGVERVEITRGPESALYGENAIGSVINVVSETGEGSPHFSLTGEGGSYDTYNLATGGAGLNHGIDWAYDLSRLSTQGPVMDDSYRNQTSFVTLGYSQNPRRQLVLHFFGDAGREENPGPWGSDPDDLYPGIAASVLLQKQDLFGY